MSGVLLCCVNCCKLFVVGRGLRLLFVARHPLFAILVYAVCCGLSFVGCVMCILLVVCCGLSCFFGYYVCCVMCV